MARMKRHRHQPAPISPVAFSADDDCETASEEGSDSDAEVHDGLFNSEEDLGCWAEDDRPSKKANTQQWADLLLQNSHAHEATGDGACGAWSDECAAAAAPDDSNDEHTADVVPVDPHCECLEDKEATAVAASNSALVEQSLGPQPMVLCPFCPRCRTFGEDLCEWCGPIPKPVSC